MFDRDIDISPKPLPNMINMQNVPNIGNFLNMGNFMNMPNMQNSRYVPNPMPNQFINFRESNIEELIRPYKEKIKRLEEELEEKRDEIDKLRIKLFQSYNTDKKNQQFNDIGNQINNQLNPMNISNNTNNNYLNKQNNINNFENPMNMMNNNIFNPMNNQINKNNINNNPNNNNIINNPMFHMCNQIKDNNNISQILPRGGNDFKDKTKFLSLIFKNQNGISISIQCKSDDKMEDAINKFFVKSGYYKTDYEFIVSKKIKELKKTVEENGLVDKNCFISVIKKSENDINEENEIKNDNVNDNDIINNDNIIDYLSGDQMEKNKTNIKIKGQEISINFITTVGSHVRITIGVNNSFREAAILFCKNLDIPISVLDKDILFLYNSNKINILGIQTVGELGIKDGHNITVFDCANVIGA